MRWIVCEKEQVLLALFSAPITVKESLTWHSITAGEARG